MKLLRFILFSYLAAFPVFSLATNLDGVTIEKLHLNRNTGNVVYINSVSNQTRISCHTNNNWDYMLPLETELDKAIYSTILSSYIAGKAITLVGTDDCSSIYGQVEALRSIHTM